MDGCTDAFIVLKMFVSVLQDFIGFYDDNWNTINVDKQHRSNSHVNSYRNWRTWWAGHY